MPPTRLLSRLIPGRRSPDLDVVSFEDSNGRSLDLRDSLSHTSEQDPDLKEKVRDVWRECKKERGGFLADFNPGPKNFIYCNDFRWRLDRIQIQKAERRSKLEALCAELGVLASCSQLHFENLENRLSEHLLCILRSDDPEEVVIGRACQILGRLPRTALKMDCHNHDASLLGAAWPKEYFVAPSNEVLATCNNLVSSTPPWEDLKVVCLKSTSVIILALQILTATRGAHNFSWVMHHWLNFISDLLDCVEASSTSKNGISVYGKYVLQAYLWTEWQRSTMLFMYHVLGNELRSGYDGMWADIMALRRNSMLERTFVKATLDESSNAMSKYMCPWAFELLKANRSSVGSDFRVFHTRFAMVHGNQAARCQSGSDEPCEGGHPLACGRFVDKSLVAAEQSVHDSTCSKQCDRIIWDEKSYKSITGARAVSLKRNPRSITYCEASEDTMAVSHVWSHGQGGRPSTGINRCLHDRYRKIAEREGCKSYWIDSVCIPEDHDLRKEAIGYINKTFIHSKVTLVCDKDLINLELNDAADDIELLESVIATFLVCDWNVRAWTLLEGCRGNHAARLLCKNNKTVSLRQIWARIYLEGRIDLAVLSLSSRHLLPRSSDGDHDPLPKKSVEDGGSLLSHRQASRDGDDIVIWTLLCDVQICEKTGTMWRNRVGHRINTGYLMNMTERVQNVQGFSWAPSSPYVRRMNKASRDPNDSLILSFAGEGSEQGKLTAKGLRAVWLIYDMTEDDAKPSVGASTTVPSKNHSLASGSNPQNVCWDTAVSLRKTKKWVRLLHPKSSRGAEPYPATRDRGRTHGPLIAICTTANGDAEDVRWHWNGVYEWPRSVALPQFDLDEVMLV